jgi:hypothetical protein
MTDDTTIGHIATDAQIVDDEKFIHVEATRKTDSGGIRIEHRTAEATHIGAEVGVVLLGWDESGAMLNLTGAEWVD